MKLLENAGLVGFRKEGLRAHCFLAKGHANPYAVALFGSRQHWLSDQHALEALHKML